MRAAHPLQTFGLFALQGRCHVEVTEILSGGKNHAALHQHAGLRRSSSCVAASLLSEAGDFAACVFASARPRSRTLRQGGCRSRSSYSRTDIDESRACCNSHQMVAFQGLACSTALRHPLPTSRAARNVQPRRAHRVSVVHALRFGGLEPRLCVDVKRDRIFEKPCMTATETTFRPRMRAHTAWLRDYNPAMHRV